MGANALADLERLLHTPAPPRLGPGPRPHVESVPSLTAKLHEVRSEHGLEQTTHDLILALVLLWHDHLHAAHAIVQEIPNAEGSWIHGILHRREPDYWNAKYWFRRVGEHPAFGGLARILHDQLGQGKGPAPLPAWLSSDRWDALAFVDLCQTCADLAEAEPTHRLAVRMQAAEWHVLLRHLVARRDR